jgi:hypothetical protein
MGAEGARAGMDRGVAEAIDQHELAKSHVRARRHEDLEGLGGARAQRHQIEAGRAERRVGDILGRHHAHAGPGMGAARRHRRR